MSGVTLRADASLRNVGIVSVDYMGGYMGYSDCIHTRARARAHAHMQYIYIYIINCLQNCRL